jgi:catecholate siderophore receptor
MKKLVIIVIMCFVSATRATAQSDSGSTKPNARVLAPVVIRDRGTKRSGYAATRSSTATKTDTPLRDVPQAVTTVSRELIADQRMQSMADVVRYVPGVTMAQGDGNRDAPTIRGNNSTADFFVDGVRDDAQYFRDLYNMDRVESLRGSNAMVFGRGGGGGVINRVSKEAGWAAVRDVSVEAGSWDHKRGTLDVGQGITDALALRLNGMYQSSGLFRDDYRLRRLGVTPTVTAELGAATTAKLSYEYFDDHRTVDRGIPSFRGRPSSAPLSTFFGNPDSSYADARIHAAAAVVEHRAASGLTIRNRTRAAHYDKFYENVFPGAVDTSGRFVSISGYNNATVRGTLFNQTDVTRAVVTSAVVHTLLAGAELGREVSDNLRNTAFFNGTATAVNAAFDRPTIVTPAAFRPNATDANNHVLATVGAVYVQDQAAFSPRWQAIAGLRAEQFGLAFHNNRDGSNLSRTDRMLSPRVGLVFKPAGAVSLYSSYSVSHLPSSGDQFSSLTATTQTLEPEAFRNAEIGAKWDVADQLSVTGAAYRLDRTNTSAKDPNDASRTVQTGSQRTAGYELAATGSVTRAWQLAGAFSAQRARIVSRTTAAAAGASVPLVPSTMFSVWNKYQVQRALGLGLGVIHQARTYAAIDNLVTLPAFTRIDGAVYFAGTSRLRPQLNVENLFNTRYFATANNNNNITPGTPRAVRLSVSASLP